MVEDSREGNMGTHCDTNCWHYYVVGGNKVEDSCGDFDLNYHLDS